MKRTGLWDETLLIWGGEFGRTPTSEGVGKLGRDHNHACLRTLQFLRAPTFLQDSRQLENAIGSRPIREGAPFGKWLSHKQNRWLYRVAIERGYYDSFLDNYGARPFLWLFNSCDRLEQRWADFLAGRTNTSASRPYVDVPPPNDPRENPTN